MMAPTAQKNCKASPQPRRRLTNNEKKEKEKKEQREVEGVIIDNKVEAQNKENENIKRRR